jgi:stress-induced-phosphoprotein 1
MHCCSILMYHQFITSAGEKDADKCIELKPDFAKGYSRKAHVQFFMKEYEKAIETYEKGLAFDPTNQELKDGVHRCRQAIQKFMMGTATEDEIKERQAKAMSDPEV